MGKPNPKKLEKRRRAKKEQKHRHDAVAAGAVTAYHGNKYRCDQYATFYLATETAIHECSVMLDGRLTDRSVRTAIESLIRSIRRGEISLDAISEQDFSAGGSSEELLTWNILCHWKEYQARCAMPGRDAVVGILRSTLGSIDTWSSPAPDARGYLNYLRGFLADLGVQTEVLSEDVFADMGDERVTLDSLLHRIPQIS